MRITENKLIIEDYLDIVEIVASSIFDSAYFPIKILSSIPDLNIEDFIAYYNTNREDYDNAIWDICKKDLDKNYSSFNIDILVSYLKVIDLDSEELLPDFVNKKLAPPFEINLYHLQNYHNQNTFPKASKEELLNDKYEVLM